jgi:nucleotide-binding universal stress UspA family protein
MSEIHCILFPADFSPCSKQAFQVAWALARSHGARLIVLHVDSPLPFAPCGADILEMLRIYDVPDSHSTVEHRVETGAPAGTILRVAREAKPELIVMGTHGITGVERLMGSVAEEVVRKAPCAVMTIKAHGPSMFAIRRILYPTDFSESSLCAFPLACSLAQDFGARIVVLHACPWLTAVDTGVERQPPCGCREDSWSALRRVLAMAPEIGVGYELAEGEPGVEIVNAAQKNHCDLIVMSTHGRTGLRRLLMGSVAEKVLRAASCPVVTVKPFSAEVVKAVDLPARELVNP